MLPASHKEFGKTNNPPTYLSFNLFKGIGQKPGMTNEESRFAALLATLLRLGFADAKHLGTANGAHALGGRPAVLHRD
jgi:hypothetical protein